MKVVLANGCFDPLHYGHLVHLQAAKALGYLIVAVTRDEYVDKGPDRPAFPQDERLAMVVGLRCVNAAILSESALDALQKVKPNVFVKGEDYEGRIQSEVIDYCKENNIRIEFTRGKRYSSTKLLQHYAANHGGR